MTFGLRLLHTTPLMSAKPLVAVCQLTSTQDKAENLRICKSLIADAKSRQAKVIFFPECFDLVGRSIEESLSLAESVGGNFITTVRDAARSEQIWVSLGGFHEKPSEQDNQGEVKKLFNTHLLINSEGEIVSRYRKLHLFDLDIPNKVRLKESDFTIPGTQFEPPCPTPVGKLGLMTCYDLRFPELAGLHRLNGAELLSYPSAFTLHTGMAHWEVLLRSRAIENQTYVVAAAQSGRHNDKRISYGHAMIVDPWGTVIAQCGDSSPDLCVAAIDLGYVAKVREQLPCHSHRRTDVYQLSCLQRPHYDSDERPFYDFGPSIKVPSSAVFYRTQFSYAFVNKKPVVPGHVLVCPIRVANRLRDLMPAEVTDMFLCAQTVQVQMEKFHNTESSTLAVQDGVDSGQTIPHVHIHLLPRKPGDFEANDDVYKELQTHDKSTDLRPSRSDEAMAEEAAEYRKLFITRVG